MHDFARSDPLFAAILHNKRSYALRKFHRKTPVLESLFIKTPT